MTDLMIYETGDGGDVKLINNYDLAVIDGLTNQSYLAHFGGNVEQSTTEDIEENQERFDWWGNAFDDEEHQMNSSFERKLNDTALTTNGRSILEEEALSDLEYLQDVVEVESIVSIPDVNKVKLLDSLTEPNTDNVLDTRFIWDNTRSTIIQEQNI